MGSKIVRVRDVIPAGHPQPYGFSLTNPPEGTPQEVRARSLVDMARGGSRKGDGAGLPREWAGYGKVYPPYGGEKPHSGHRWSTNVK